MRNNKNMMGCYIPMNTYLAIRRLAQKEETTISGLLLKFITNPLAKPATNFINPNLMPPRKESRLVGLYVSQEIKGQMETRANNNYRTVSHELRKIIDEAIAEQSAIIQPYTAVPPQA